MHIVPAFGLLFPRQVSQYWQLQNRGCYFPGRAAVDFNGGPADYYPIYNCFPEYTGGVLYAGDGSGL
jgi:hypothetical protein